MLKSADFTEDTIKNDKNDACFFSFMTIRVSLGLLTYHDIYNIRILSENIYFISTRCETGKKTRHCMIHVRSLQDRVAFIINIYQHNKFIRVTEILFVLIWVDGRGTMPSKSWTFVVLQLVTNVALIEYTWNCLYILTAKIVRAERNSILQLC